MTNSTDVPSTPAELPQLNWNWAELSALIAQLQNIQCNNGNATVTVPTPSVNGGSFNIFAVLGLPWGEWSSLATSNLDINAWSKADWKLWIQNYVTYWNAVQTYISEGEAILGSVAGGISGTVGGAVGGVYGSYEDQIRSGIVEAQQIISSAALYFNQTTIISGTANFTQFWKPEWDLDSVSIAEIKQDLNITSNVIGQVSYWFTSFFVEGGVDAVLGQNTVYVIEVDNGQETNITTGTGSNTVVLNVPGSVESIVAWISSNFQAELQSVLSTYNITFNTGSYV